MRLFASDLKKNCVFLSTNTVMTNFLRFTALSTKQCPEKAKSQLTLEIIEHIIHQCKENILKDRTFVT